MVSAKMKIKQILTTASDKTEVTREHIPTQQDLPNRDHSYG